MSEEHDSYRTALQVLIKEPFLSAPTIVKPTNSGEVAKRPRLKIHGKREKRFQLLPLKITLSLSKIKFLYLQIHHLKTTLTTYCLHLLHLLTVREINLLLCLLVTIWSTNSWLETCQKSWSSSCCQIILRSHLWGYGTCQTNYRQRSHKNHPSYRNERPESSRS